MPGKQKQRDLIPVMDHGQCRRAGKLAHECCNYAGLLGQLGLEPRFFSGDSKRLLQKEIAAVCTEQKKKVICVLDEAHLLGKDMLEELRFLLNHEFDSSSPMSLVLVGQTELWEQKLRLQAYAAIRQRTDMNIVLGRLSDLFWNRKRLSAHMNGTDAVTVAHALRALSGYTGRDWL